MAIETWKGTSWAFQCGKYAEIHWLQMVKRKENGPCLQLGQFLPSNSYYILDDTTWLWNIANNLLDICIVDANHWSNRNVSGLRLLLQSQEYKWLGGIDMLRRICYKQSSRRWEEIICRVSQINSNNISLVESNQHLQNDWDHEVHIGNDSLGNYRHEWLLDHYDFWCYLFHRNLHCFKWSKIRWGRSRHRGRWMDRGRLHE